MAVEKNGNVFYWFFLSWTVDCGFLTRSYWDTPPSTLWRIEPNTVSPPSPSGEAERQASPIDNDQREWKYLVSLLGNIVSL